MHAAQIRQKHQRGFRAATQGIAEVFLDHQLRWEESGACGQAKTVPTGVIGEYRGVVVGPCCEIPRQVTDVLIGVMPSGDGTQIVSEMPLAAV